jgi:hypothetical protein
MGRAFPLIADEALIPLDASYYSQCQVCNQTKPAYVTYGRAFLKGKTQREKVFAACKTCFKGGKIEQVREGLPLARAVQEYVGRYFKRKSAKWLEAKRKEMIDQLDRMPCHLPPLRQELDWALCCGELTEYLGSPGGRRDLLAVKDLRAWNFGVDERSEDAINFEGCPDELLGDIAVFRCGKCSQHYLIFQPT